MSGNDKKQWITINGAHIPIGSGQTREDAILEFMKDHDIPSKENARKEEQKSKSEAPRLSRREYAVWYKKIGEIERGGYVRKTKSGSKFIPLEVEENGVVTYKIAITGGSYVSPSLDSVVEFESGESLADFLNKLEGFL